MKNLNLFLLGILFLTASCKKDKANDNYYLTCKIDGVQKTFNTEAVAGAQSQDDQSVFVAHGVSAASESAEGMWLMIEKAGSAINTGTYTVDGDAYTVTIIYTPEPATSGYLGGTGVNSAEGENILKVVITHMDDKSVRGTFSGEVFESGASDGAKKIISEGSFNLKLTNQVPG